MLSLSLSLYSPLQASSTALLLPPLGSSYLSTSISLSIYVVMVVTHHHPSSSLPSSCRPCFEPCQSGEFSPGQLLRSPCALYISFLWPWPGLFYCSPASTFHRATTHTFLGLAAPTNRCSTRKHYKSSRLASSSSVLLQNERRCRSPSQPSPAVQAPACYMCYRLQHVLQHITWPITRSMDYRPPRGLRPAAWTTACSLDYGLQHGLQPAAWITTCSLDYGLQHGLRPAAWTTTCSLDYGLQPGLRPAAWTTACSMDYGLQHGLRPAAWTTACSLDYGLQPGLRPAAWTAIYSMDYGLQHGLRPAAWTTACSMDYGLQHRPRPAAWTTACMLPVPCIPPSSPRASSFPVKHI